MRKIIFMIILSMIIIGFSLCFALQTIELNLENVIELKDSFKTNHIDPNAYYVDIGLVTEADCDNIKWTVEGQTHYAILDCDTMLIFTGAQGGMIYNTTVEGCGGRFEGYLDVGYSDTVFCICPHQLQMNECCPISKGENDQYFCDECPYEPKTTTSSAKSTTSSIKNTTSSSTTSIGITTTTTSIKPPPEYFFISGHIIGDIIYPIKIILTGTESEIIETDTGGFYGFSDLENGYYIITPEKEKCSFEPLNYTIQKLSNNLYDIDFKNTCTRPTPCAMEEIYGEDSEEVILMKYLRDEILSQSPEGRELIVFYYQWSPVIMKAIEEDSQFKQQLKETIDQFLET